MVKIGNDWDIILKDEFKKDYYLKLRKFLISEYRNNVIYPNMYDIFNALKFTTYDDVKVVILGQDPYHEAGQAHGLAFSVLPGVIQPPSLTNIFKELESDLGITPPPKNYGCLKHWAEQGVLMINSVFTVREHQANSHRGKGWEILTDTIINKLNEKEKPIIFILWGGKAKAKKELITNPIHYILEGAHPSPFSAYNGFFGGKYFSKTNDILTTLGFRPIDWKIEAK